MKINYKGYSYCRAIVPAGQAGIADYKSQLGRKYSLAPNLNQSRGHQRRACAPDVSSANSLLERFAGRFKTHWTLFHQQLIKIKFENQGERA